MIRPIEKLDAPRWLEMLSQPEILSNHAPWPTLAQVEENLSSPSGDKVHRLGLFRDHSLCGAFELTPSIPARCRHVAELVLYATNQADALVLLKEATQLADLWLGLFRLEITIDPQQTMLIAALEQSEFQLEVRQKNGIFRQGKFLDRLIFGRIRPDWAPLPAGSPEAPSEAQRRTPPPICTYGRLRPTDLAPMTQQLRHPDVAWGLLQIPSLSQDLFASRMNQNPSQNFFLGAYVEDELVGSGGFHRHPWPREHVAGMGISFKPSFQGCGLGVGLMKQIIETAFTKVGLTRLELEVYTDNFRGIRLYERMGFVAEGIRRKPAFKLGGYADDLCMALYNTSDRAWK